MNSETHEIRCSCPTRPLLALYGVDPQTASVYVHVKMYRKDKVYTEVVIHTGRVSIWCRVCGRWHEVVIRDRVKVTETVEPGVLVDSNP